MTITNAKVDAYISRAKLWREEIEKLRLILLECDLTEELKWGVPCYRQQKNNIVLIHVFKDYCALLFFKGVLLKDPNKILIQQTENVQSARQIRFTNIAEIVKMKTILKAYVNEAIAVEKAGLKVNFKKADAFEIPDEFQNKLTAFPDLNTAFYELTPGRQRGYLLYFAASRQSKTRESRIEKWMPQILKGKGLNDE